MSSSASPAESAASSVSAWAQAQLAAALLAVDPVGLGGAVLRAGAGPVRDAWLASLQSLLPAATPWQRVPLHVQDERLLGGLDLAATLQAGRPVLQRGLLAEADGGIVVLAMAERVSANTAARLAAVLDAGEVQLARDGVTQRQTSRMAVVALDEGGTDERAPAALCDRLSLWLDLSLIAPGALSAADHAVALPQPHEVTQARGRLGRVAVPDEVWHALCAAALAMGIASMRAPLLAVRVARALAALAARDEVEPEDAAFAARCVLGPRATLAPPGERDAQEPPPEHEPPPPEQAAEQSSADTGQALDERVLAAAAATLPAHLLDRLAPQSAVGRASHAAAGAGAQRASRHRGAPLGARRGDPRSGQRLDLLATLRAAAPWQALRGASTGARPGGDGLRRVAVRRDDFRVKHFRERSQTTVIFVVDASGSAALHRLAEAKGAVELLLADCYARRDSVAVLAFRGQGAELLLPPTRSLVRAKRSLAGLPGGGGTPLAHAVDAAGVLASSVQRRGDTPLAVVLSDGRANIARDGSGGRERAQADALLAARVFRTQGITALFLDTSPRPQPLAQDFARALGATYLPLPQADARSVSSAVRSARAAQERA